MKKLYIASIITIVLITAMGFMTFNQPMYTNIPTNAFGTGAVIDATRFSNWIGNATPVTNVFVLPADSPNFVGDNPIAPDSTPNTADFDRQDFFRWSQQMFLWILSPVPADGSYGSCKGLVLNSPEFFDIKNGKYTRHRCDSQLFESRSFDVKSTQNGKNNLPLFIEKDTEKIFDVAPTPRSKDGFQLVKNELGRPIAVSKIIIEKQTPIFYDRYGKKIEKIALILDKNLLGESTVQQFIIDDQIINIIVPQPFNPIVIANSQAQASINGNQNVLMARNGSLVYYNIMVNDVYAVFSQMVLNGNLPSTSHFPTTVNELNDIKAYGASHGIPLINTENRVLAMELKTSWVEAINLPNIGDYVTTPATIPNYVKTSTGVWTRNGTRAATLALVGMHVVGSAFGHPEMIWSTFEHINNTPNRSFTFTGNGQFPATDATGDAKFAAYTKKRLEFIAAAAPAFRSLYFQ